MAGNLSPCRSSHAVTDDEDPAKRRGDAGILIAAANAAAIRQHGEDEVPGGHDKKTNPQKTIHSAGEKTKTEVVLGKNEGNRKSRQREPHPAGG
jgi:hypothetical protein